MTEAADAAPPVDGAATVEAAEDAGGGNSKLAILLAMAMFVLVVDTSFMNVSISAVVADLGTTVSAVQSAIALEALVSAAFILLGSKIADLIGRKIAYVLGLLGYAIGAIAMTLTQSIVPVIIFWSIIGGIGASLLLPSMQSLIHGNFEGKEQTRVYALVGASAAIAAAIGPLIGGFITTFLSWRLAFLGEAVIIGVVLLGIGLVKDVPYTGSRAIDLVGAGLSIVGMGGIVLGILAWQEGAEAVAVLIIAGGIAMAAFAWWLVRQKRAGKPTLDRSGPVQVRTVPARDLRADAPADLAGRPDDRPADLPPDGLRVQRTAGGPVDRAAVAEHVRDRHPGRKAGGPAAAQHDHPGRLPAPADRGRVDHPDRASRRRGLAAGAVAASWPGPGSASSSRSSTTTRSRRSARSGSARPPG